MTAHEKKMEKRRPLCTSFRPPPSSLRRSRLRLRSSGQLSIFDISKGGAPVKALQLGKRKLYVGLVWGGRFKDERVDDAGGLLHRCRLAFITTSAAQAALAIHSPNLPLCLPVPLPPTPIFPGRRTSKVQLSFNSLTPEGSIMASSLNNELLVWDLAQVRSHKECFFFSF